MSRREKWLIGGGLAVLLVFSAARARVWVLAEAEAAGASSPYAECGEVLLHGYAPARSACPSLYMPAAGATAARLFGHRASWPWREAAIVAGLLSVAGLCVLAGAARAAPVALLLLIAFPALWPAHQSYVQFFYALYVVTAAAALVWREADPTPLRTAVFAAAVGASVLFRSPLAFLPPLIAGLDWARRSRYKRTNSLILLVVPYAALLPWVLMNRAVHGQWSLFERGEALPNIVTAALGKVFFVDQEWREAVRAAPELQNQKLLECLAWAFAEIARHPLRYLEGAAGRLSYVLGLYPALFAAAAAGLWRHRRSPAARALGGLCAYFLLIHVSIAVLENYMVPLWPLLAALAGFIVAPKLSPAPAPYAVWARNWLLFCVAALGLTGLEAGVRAARYGLLASRRPPVSDAALTAALALEPDDAWLAYQDGWRRMRLGDKPGAAAAWNRAVERAPGVAMWELHRAWALSLAGEPGLLLAWDRPAPSWSSEGQRADADLLQAHALLRLGRRAEARERLRSAVAYRVSRSHGGGRDLLSLEILWDRARELFGLLPPRDWLDLWSELRGLARTPEQNAVARRCDPMRDAVIGLQNAGRHAEASALLAELLAKRPDAADLWTDKAVNEAMAGDWTKAVPDLEKAIAADKTFWPAYLSLGAVHARLGRPEKARAVYDRALGLGAGSDDPLLGRIRAARGE